MRNESFSNFEREGVVIINSRLKIPLKNFHALQDVFSIKIVQILVLNHLGPESRTNSIYNSDELSDDEFAIWDPSKNCH